MIRKVVLIGAAAAAAVATPLTVLAVTGSSDPAPAGVTQTIQTREQAQIRDQTRLQLRDGSCDGQQLRVGAPAEQPGGYGWATGPQDGTGQQHQGPASR